MGIRFLCPACGHKLNVKAFLAGKRGVCPQCASGLDIPLESQIHRDGTPLQPGFPVDEWLDLSDDGPAGVAPATAPVVNSPLIDPPQGTPAAAPASPVSEARPLPVVFPTVAATEPHPASATQPAVVPAVPLVLPAAASPEASVGRAPIASPLPAPARGQPVLGTQPVAPMPTVPLQPTVQIQPAAPVQPVLPLPTVVDPIAERPDGVWYVRPPSGGQYGPARGDIMRRWINEGRVSGDSLVWREGWDDWRSASETFPSLRSVATPPVPPASVDYAPTTPRPAATMPVFRPARRNSMSFAFAMVVLLVVVTVVLSVALVIVLKK